MKPKATRVENMDFLEDMAAYCLRDFIGLKKGIESFVRGSSYIEVETEDRIYRIEVN
jgi:hypothetical protein